ncbi:polyamine aminopropyltransferase [Hazenella sp. IB182357]|uniref:Polyamine aminopropyltransferase n=1 Tax=Polycladospora coralii TaxID=2771432 RepID=A0A926RU13_9BACL|nr:polyamine aminopropyltransferase [Polycladospora coralii]MBD1372017.1 polyamine aminopropyltransferase [Polycladospora coralii]MBS7530523.1 polyamine aminopropyltransferase [Polycladospora coralii]
MNTELWYTEKQTKNHGITTKVNKSIYHDQSAFQTLDVMETAEFGNLLVLDGMVMTTDRDEFVYHEMITHIAMNTHPNPKSVLVVGGGDGGAIREILRYPSVEKAVLAEIDGKVIEASQKYFPKIASGLSDPRVDIQVADGIRHIQENKGKYDVILVDSTEPVGPAVGLFQKPFYEGIFEALKEDGIMVAQTESPWFNQELISQVFQDISNTFSIARLYTASIPTYPSGLWSFTIGSKKYDPLHVDESKLIKHDTKYYHPDMHKALFQLPQFVQDLLIKKGE